MMRHPLALMSIFALVGATTGSGDEVLPSQSTFDRYSAMVDHSPFAVATAVALPAATPNFAKDLYVANAAHSPAGDMVTIASSSDRNFKKYLTSKQAVDGYRIESVEWSDRVGASKATISKDGKFATLTFNEALLAQRAAPNVPPAPDQMSQKMPPPQSVPAMTFPDPPKVSRGGAHLIKQKPGASAVSTPDLPPVSPGSPDPPQLKSPQQRHEEKMERRRQMKIESMRPVAPMQPQATGSIRP